MDFPDPETPVTPAKQAEGNVDVDAAQVVDARALELEVLAAGFAAGAWGTGMVRRPERYLPVMEFGFAMTSGTVPAARSWPPSSPAPGAEVEQVVRGANDVGVVLDDEDSVAKIAEVFHDADELGGIASVEADGRVRPAHRARPQAARTKRRRKLNAL